MPPDSLPHLASWTVVSQQGAQVVLSGMRALPTHGKTSKVMPLFSGRRFSCRAAVCAAGFT